MAVLKFWTCWGGLHRCRPEDIDRWRTRGQAALDVMELHLARTPFFVGERFGIADIALFAYTQSAEAVGFSVGPAVRGWLTRVAAQPGHVALEADPVR